jgi:hypothetical protein
MFEIAIALLVGAVCGRVLSLYNGTILSQQKQPGANHSDEEIPVTEAKDEDVKAE